ncbi:MAG: HepT-like ribonuclease domain-containing protein [Bacteroidia bacterium]
MSKRSEKAILQDIIMNIQAILDFTRGMEWDQFSTDLKTQYAVDCSFEIIGEATRQLPESFLHSHPEIEWQKMIAFRKLIDT